MNIAAVVVLGFAAYRATRIFTKDSITDTFRERMYDWAWRDDGTSAPVARSSWRAYLYEGLSCAFCLGVWCSFVLVSIWQGLPWNAWHDGRWLLYALAVAGVQAFIASRPDA